MKGPLLPTWEPGAGAQKYKIHFELQLLHLALAMLLAKLGGLVKWGKCNVVSAMWLVQCG